MLVVRDDLGQSTAIAVGGADQAVAVARTDSRAVGLVSDYLHWQLKRESWLDAPEILDPRLTIVRVTVRPEYRFEHRIYPCPESITVPIHCVHGRQATGLYFAVLPLLRMSFYYFEENTFTELVIRYAQECLKGKSPRDIASALPPARVELRTLVVRSSVRRENPQFLLTARHLPTVGDTLGNRQMRHQFRQAWERDAALQDLVRLLSARRQNLLLVGEAGVGKTTLLATAIRQLSREPQRPSAEGVEDKPPVEQRYWLTSGARLIAGMKYLGQWEQRCEQIISELADLGGVLCIENLRELLSAGGGEPGSGVASFLLPYLQRGELQMIAECTPAELIACGRLLPGLLDVFQIVNVPPFDRRGAVAVLERLIGQLHQQYRLEAERGVADLTERLFHRFLPYQVFPGSTLAFLSELFAARAREQMAIGTAGPALVPVTTGDVLRQFIRRTGLPEFLLRDDCPVLHAEVVARFEQRVIGQPVACRIAADLITTFKAGLNDPARPVASLLFCGPTGVGKTEMARALADEFFGHGDQRERLIRLDMSEYAGFDAASRLLTRPDGEPSRLVESLRRQPLSVVLFDEIEKAAPDVFDVLLGLLDEGRLTDHYGRVTSFRCAIVIMTSNLGADRQQSIGFEARAASSYEREVRSFFRPEFFNRLTGVVTFAPLDSDSARQITRREIGLLNLREGMTRRNLRLQGTERVVDAILARGFDLRYGARPLQRTIERMIAGPLAQWLMDHSDTTQSTMTVDWDEGLSRVRFQV